MSRVLQAFYIVYYMQPASCIIQGMCGVCSGRTGRSILASKGKRFFSFFPLYIFFPYFLFFFSLSLSLSSFAPLPRESLTQTFVGQKAATHTQMFAVCTSLQALCVRIQGPDVALFHQRFKCSLQSSPSIFFFIFYFFGEFLKVPTFEFSHEYEIFAIFIQIY